MSRSTYTTSSSCKMCEDSGKPQKIFASHNVRDKDRQGDVICPTLRAHVCGCCHAKGKHTLKFCPRAKALASMSSEQRRTVEKFAAKIAVNSVSRIEVRVEVQKPTKIKSKTGGFSVLMDESDSESESDAKPQVRLAEREQRLLYAAGPTICKPKPIQAPNAWINAPLRASQMNWADVESDDEEDDSGF